MKGKGAGWPGRGRVRWSGVGASDGAKSAVAGRGGVCQPRAPGAVGVREGERVKMLALSSGSETSGDGNVAEGDALEAGGGHRIAEGLGGKDEARFAGRREEVEPDGMVGQQYRFPETL